MSGRACRKVQDRDTQMRVMLRQVKLYRMDAMDRTSRMARRKGKLRRGRCEGGDE